MGNFQNSPDHFIAEAKGGVVYEFGKENNSKNNIGGKPVNWLLSKAKDVFGNYILYKYKLVNNQTLLDEILYTGNSTANIAPYNSIKFIYEERQDKFEGYSNGNLIKAEFVVRQIICKSEGQIAMKYYLEYGFHNYQTYLLSIKQTNNNGVALNPTFFNYGIDDEFGNNSFESIDLSSINRSGYTQTIKPFDYNGDGVVDLAVFYKKERSTLTRTILSSNNYNFEMSDELQGTGVGSNYFNFAINENTSTTIAENFEQFFLSGNLRTVYYFGNQIENTDGIVSSSFIHSPLNMASPTNNPGWIRINENWTTTDFYEKATVFQNQGNGTFNEVYTISNLNKTEHNFCFDAKSYGNGIANLNFFGIDFNSDLKQEFILSSVKVMPDLNNGNVIYKSFMFYRMSDDGVTRTFESEENEIVPRTNFCDLDGDGIPELILLYHQSNTFKVYKFDRISRQFNSWFNQTISGSSVNFIDNSTLDLDGDGLQEIIGGKYSDGGMAFLKFDINTLSFILNSRASNEENRICYSKQSESNFFFSGNGNFDLSGDFNGDGFIDKLNGSAFNFAVNFRMFLNKGNNDFVERDLENTELAGHSFNYIQVPPGTNSFNNPNKVKYYTCDVNRDGITDLIESNAVSSQNKKIKVFLIKPNGVNLIEFDAFLSSFPIFDDLYDINGDGSLDLFYSSNKILNFPFAKNTSKLKLVKNGLGNVTHFSYSNFISVNLFNIYPFLGVSRFYNLCNKITNNFQLQVSEQSSVSYNFKNGIIHLLGKGFLGFLEVSQFQNNGTKAKSYQFMALNASLISLLPSKLIEADFANNSLVESSSTFVNIPRSSLNTFNSKLQTISSLVKKYKVNPTSINSDTNPVSFLDYTNYPYTPIPYTSINTNYTYDNDGNVLTESQNIGDGLQQTYTVYSNYNSNGTWLPNKPENVSTTVTRQGQDPISSSIAFEYYENGSLKKKTIHPNLPKKIITEYEYYDTGNLEKETVSCQDGSFAPKISTNTYDTKFRFLKENNTQGEIAKFEYEPKYGIKTKETVANGLSTTFEFGNFGQVNSSTDYLNNQVHKVKYWVESGDVPNANVLDNANTAVYYEKVWGTQSPTQKTFFDAYGRVVLIEQQLRENQFVYTQTKYQDGLPFKSTSSFELNYPNRAIVSTNNYNEVLRLENSVIQDPSDGNSGMITNYTVAYVNGKLKTTITKPDGTVESKIFDDTGQLIKSIDPNGTIEYEYYSDGKLKNTKVNNLLVNTVTYDEYRQQTSLWDMSAGTTSYTYDAASNLKTQTDARGITYTFEYNSYNQIETKTGPEGVYSYQYEADGMAKHSLKKVVQPNGNFQEYFFDEYGRVKKTREKIAAESFDFEFEFDQWGKVVSKKYPNGFTTENEFDNLGNLIKIKNQSSGAAIWTLNTLNEQGKVTSSSFGSGAFQTTTFTKFGFLDAKLDYLNSGTDFLFSYQFDERNGNLNNRKNLSFGVFENFEYENEKLTSASATGGYLKEVDYDFVTKTNIKSKTGVGNYTYHPTKKHAVKNVENTADLISSNEQNIIFNEQNRAKEIFEGMYKAEFDYSASAHRQSMKMMVTEDPNAANPAYNLNYTRYYLGEYEKEVRGNTTTEVCYINTPIGLTAAYVTENNISEMYYLHTDHLGSIIGVSNNIQQKIYEVSYDAWGKKRPVQFWFASSVVDPTPSWLWRGYTGHEHLEEFALINMNARLYDPILGRMISPDNYVSNASNSQDYNRYSYCRNNPLKYTDPTGNYVQYIIGAAVGGFAGYQIGQAEGSKGWELFGYTMLGAGIGAVTAGIGTGVAGSVATTGSALGIFGAGAIGAAAGGAVAGAISGASFSSLSGAKGEDALVAGVKGGITGMVGGGLGALTGGYLGSIIGGFAGGYVGTGLQSGDWGRQAIINGGIGGTLSLATYSMSQEVARRSYVKSGGKLNRAQWNIVSIQSQRSFARNREWGAYFTKNGGIKSWGFSKSSSGFTSSEIPQNTSEYVGEIHTHPNGFVSQTSQRQFPYFSRTDSDYIGTRNSFMLSQNDGLKSFDLDLANSLSTKYGCFESLDPKLYNSQIAPNLSCPTGISNDNFNSNYFYILFYGK
jgi:RHS repeat-associated protein